MTKVRFYTAVHGVCAQSGDSGHSWVILGPARWNPRNQTSSEGVPGAGGVHWAEVSQEQEEYTGQGSTGAVTGRVAQGGVQQGTVVYQARVVGRCTPG